MRVEYTKLGTGDYLIIITYVDTKNVTSFIMDKSELNILKSKLTEILGD